MPPGQRVGRYARGLADLFGNDNTAFQALGHVLQPRRDVYRVADRGEHGVIAKADVADDDVAAVNPIPNWIGSGNSAAN